MAPVRLRCAVIIATRNRRADLERTLAALDILNPRPDEVLLLADGCTDGTQAMVRTRWPQHRLLEEMPGRGSVPARDRLIRESNCELILSIDDDSHPVEETFLEHVAGFFRHAPRLAVLAFPQRSDEFPETLTCTSFGPSRYVGTYTSSAAVLRRHVYLELGGYTSAFKHAYEEPDFALRCVAAGWQVRLETSLTVRHYYTGQERNEQRTHHGHARNEVWSVALRCPLPLALGVALFRVLRQAGYALSRGPAWIVREPAWWADCLSGLAGILKDRDPICWPKYLRWMRLLRHPIATEGEWLEHFGTGTPRQANTAKAP